MRAAPVGAYFMDDLGMAAASAGRSAEVTHAHPDGQAGAMAVAVAAAWIGSDSLEPGDLFQAVLKFTPPGPTREAVDVARTVPLDADVDAAVAKLGNGARVTSADTVPFCLWCVARHLGKFEEALWAAVSGLGDRDTTCAIVGGIAALHPRAQVPVDWMAAREPLDALSV